METPKAIGRYEILEELGHGAMGTVYRAKDPSLDRIVALKTIISLALASDQGSEFRERFYREARAAGRLAHPGIVAMYDVGENDGFPFLVMEFVNGQTLADAVKKGERLTLDRICEIGQHIAEALGYAHKNGVVHRDIKPANILLTSAAVYGVERPKITDFGVAKLAAGQITTTGQMLGTPAFMPPEQFTGAPIDGRADLFSLGVILYWMATGEQPFPGETMTAVSYKVVHTDPVPARKLNPSIPESLDLVIRTCLAKSPAERYQTGEELGQDLAAIRTGNATGLRVQSPLGARDEIETGATLDLRATSPVLKTVPQPQPTQAAAAPSSRRSSQLYVLAGIAVIVLALGGWYLLRKKSIAPESASAVPASASAPQESPASPTAKAPAQASPGVGEEPTTSTQTSMGGAGNTNSKAETAILPSTPPPSGTKLGGIASAKPVPPAGKPGAASKASRAGAQPEVVDFNPLTLSPKQNARLKIDANRVPPSLDFTVEMNGKVYFQRSAAGNKPEYENLFVPPGVQEFRVTARSGAVQKKSNIVSTEFLAKKKKTLSIELRIQGRPPKTGMPEGLYPDSQIILSLK